VEHQAAVDLIARFLGGDAAQLLDEPADLRADVRRQVLLGEDPMLDSRPNYD
jgi:hypothetical protein